MKKTTRWFALAMVALMLCMMLVGCAKTLTGTYSAEIDAFVAGSKTSYTFSGSKVTVTQTGELFGKTEINEYEGKYEIVEAADGTMKIVFTFDDEDADIYEGEFSFKETETSITIGIVEYTKQ